MRRIAFVLPAAFAAFAFASAAHAALTKEPFTIKKAQDLVDLCGADPSDPLYDDAINFCHGYASGAWQYHQAQANGPNGDRIICPPDNPAPKRAEAIAMFVTWAKSHPDYMNEPAVETLFRFLSEKWPCPEPAPAKKKGGSK
jgi:Rap1a immunity proteins